MIQVVFTHDDVARKWTVQVMGAENALEARQAFTAVVITCHMIDSGIQKHALVDTEYRVTPAV